MVSKDKPAPEQVGKRIDEQLQFIMSIRMEDWEVMKLAVNQEATKVTQ